MKIIFLICSFCLLSTQLFGAEASKSEDVKANSKLESTQTPTKTASDTPAASPIAANEPVENRRPSEHGVLFYIGPTINPRTAYTTSTLGVTANSNGDGKTSYSLGLEAIFPVTQTFGVSGIAEFTSYPYQSGGNPDQMSAVFIMPRFISSGKTLSVWAGLAVGVVNTTLGDVSVTGSGITLSANSSTYQSFAYSPRVGLDYNFAKKFWARLQLASFATRIQTDFTTRNASNGAFIATGTTTADRAWLSLGLGIGTDF